MTSTPKAAPAAAPSTPPPLRQDTSTVRDNEPVMSPPQPKPKPLPRASPVNPVGADAWLWPEGCGWVADPLDGNDWCSCCKPELRFWSTYKEAIIDNVNQRQKKKKESGDGGDDARAPFAFQKPDWSCSSEVVPTPDLLGKKRVRFVHRELCDSDGGCLGSACGFGDSQIDVFDDERLVGKVNMHPTLFCCSGGGCCNCQCSGDIVITEGLLAGGAAADIEFRKVLQRRYSYDAPEKFDRLKDADDDDDDDDGDDKADGNKKKNQKEKKEKRGTNTAMRSFVDSVSNIYRPGAPDWQPLIRTQRTRHRTQPLYESNWLGVLSFDTLNGEVLTADEKLLLVGMLVARQTREADEELFEQED